MLSSRSESPNYQRRRLGLRHDQDAGPDPPNVIQVLMHLTEVLKRVESVDVPG